MKLKEVEYGQNVESEIRSMRIGKERNFKKLRLTLKQREATKDFKAG